MSLKQFILIDTILKSDKLMSLTELAETIGCSRQNVKQLASNLERNGYVKFEYGKRRAVYVIATEKVNKSPEDLTRRKIDALELYFSKFSEEEIDEQLRLLEKMLEGLELVEKYSDKYVLNK